MASVIHRKVLHDGVKVKAYEAQFFNGLFRLANGHFTLGGFDSTPALNDALRMTLPHGMHILVGARWRGHRGFQIQRYQACINARSCEFSNHIFFTLGHPVSLPISGQGLWVGTL